MCENFGAYGWRLGVRDMKWLADYWISQGVNYFVPHAFSMAEYPDNDCPPHFYARGSNPQFPWFCELMKYVDRLCRLFSGGQNVPQVGLLFEAEADWSGKTMRGPVIGKELLSHQLDFMVLPADVLKEGAVVEDGMLVVNGRRMGALLVPACEFIPADAARFLAAHPELPVLFVDSFPEGIAEMPADGDALLAAALKDRKTVALEKLSETLRGMGLADTLTIRGATAALHTYHYRKEGKDLWMLMNGSCAAMSNVLAKMAKAWPDVNKAIEWTCWNFLPFDCSYPEFLPPRDGWSDTLAYAKSLGIMTMPYTNGRLWDKALASYHQFAEPWMCHDANGDVWSESWRQKKSHFGVVCPSWKTYHDILLYAATNIVHTYGAGSLYIDQVACSRPKQCFSPGHGHALGGGTHWRDGYHRAMERVHGALSAEGAPLMSEGMGEAWLDVIDGYLNAYMPHPDQVPLFTAVYSGYATAFGCRMGVETPPDAFFAMQARSTLWGCAPGWCLPWVLEPKYKAHADALYACGRVRQAAAEFLAWGTLEGEVRFDAPLETKQYSWFEMKHGKKAGSAKCELPCVSGNIWKNAEGTEWAVALVNISDVPRNVSFALPCSGRFSVLPLPWQEEPAFRQDGSRATAAIPARSFAVLSTIHSKGIQK